MFDLLLDTFNWYIIYELPLFVIDMRWLHGLSGARTLIWFSPPLQFKQTACQRPLWRFPPKTRFPRQSRSLLGSVAPQQGRRNQQGFEWQERFTIPSTTAASLHRKSSTPSFSIISSRHGPYRIEVSYWQPESGENFNFDYFSMELRS